MSSGIIWFVFAVAMLSLDVALVWLLVFRPAAVLRFFLRRRFRWDDLFAERAARMLPWRWLFGGADWQTFKTEAVTHPERYPRVLLAYRSLGVAVVGLFCVMIVVFVIVAATGH